MTKKYKYSYLISLLLLINANANAVNIVGQQYVSDEIIVKFKSPVSSQMSANFVSAKGGAVKSDLGQGLTHVRLGTGQSVESTVAAYISDSNVEYAQPNYIYHATNVPNDTNYNQQWAFKNTAQTILPVAPSVSAPYSTNNPGTTGNDINMESAWNQITDCSGVIVAVIDSGVNYNHQDLAANMWNGGFSYPNHGYNFTTEGATNDPMDLFGHGTHVAGIIGAVGNNALGSVGVCWKATIMAVRVLDATGTGSTATIISGINFAVSNGAKVINMSLGGGVAFDQAYSNAITNAQINDVVVVVSAGNEGANNDINGNAKYPCNFTNPNLICVAALDQNYSLASFSNWGSVSVDVGAPGTNMLSLWAGATSTYTDPMNMNAGSTMWLVSSNPASHQFTFGHDVPNVYPYNGGTYYSLNYPGVAYWPSGYAPANTSTYLWATLNLSGINAATLDIFGAVHVVSDGGLGSFAIAYNPAGGNPFSGTPTYFSGTSPQATDLTPALTPIFSAVPTLSLANCLTSTCTVGFQYKTGYTTFNLGASIVGFTINALTLNNSTYKLEDGTSMASPLVAGLATMLRAYNPQFTSDDVVAAIENGGSPVASLAGITKTGNAVNAIKSLAYIKAPTGLSASVQ